MSLDTVAEDIKEEAREDAEEIRAEGEQRAEAIIEDAQADAEEIVSEREDDVERRIAQERERTLSSAKLEAKQDRLEARRDVLQDVRKRASEEVGTIDGDTRQDLTKTLLEDAAREFEGQSEVRIYGREEDTALLREILAEYDGYKYTGEFDCLGGVVAESDASRVRVNNTFDSVFADVWEDELKAISDRLFEDGTGTGTKSESKTGTGGEAESGDVQ